MAGETIQVLDYEGVWRNGIISEKKKDGELVMCKIKIENQTNEDFYEESKSYLLLNNNFIQLMHNLSLR